MTTHDEAAGTVQHPENTENEAVPRDPKLDPIRGDEVVVGEDDRRAVVRVFADPVEGAQVTYGDSLSSPKRTCTLATWRRWAKHGVVVGA